MENNKENIEKGLDQFLNDGKPVIDPKKVVKKKSDLVEKVDRKLVVEDGREILREITYNRY